MNKPSTRSVLDPELRLQTTLNDKRNAIRQINFRNKRQALSPLKIDTNEIKIKHKTGLLSPTMQYFNKRVNSISIEYVNSPTQLHSDIKEKGKNVMPELKNLKYRAHNQSNLISFDNTESGRTKNSTLRATAYKFPRMAAKSIFTSCKNTSQILSEKSNDSDEVSVNIKKPNKNDNITQLKTEVDQITLLNKKLIEQNYKLQTQVDYHLKNAHINSILGKDSVASDGKPVELGFCQK